MPAACSNDFQSPAQVPAQVLPPEILSEIFMHSVRNTPSESWLRVDRPPWTLGKVCCHWRAVCLSTPSLWGNLPRLYMNTALYRDPRVLSLIQTSLDLSRTMPLSLDLTIFVDADDCITNTIPLFHQILPEMHRCRELVLACNGHSLPLLNKFSGNLGSLQSLQLRSFGSSWNFDVTQSINIFAESPSLTNASVIIDCEGSFAVGCIPLPWNQLTTLSTTDIPDSFLLDVIRNAPLLKRCSFTSAWHSDHEWDEWFPAATRHIPITHRRLESLSLLSQPGDPSVPTHFIEKLFLPSLKHLEWKYMDSHTARLISLIERSRCTLLSLTTHAKDLNREIISLLGCIPHIRELKLRGISGESLAVMTIAPSASASALVPKLQNLAIELPQCTSRDIQDFIRSRTVDLELGSVQHLEVVKLSFKSEKLYWEIYHQLEGWSTHTPGDDEAYTSILYRKRVLENLVQVLRKGGKSQLLKVRLVWYNSLAEASSNLSDDRHCRLKRIWTAFWAPSRKNPQFKAYI
ncbi:hypothetical protein M413DRAFT_345653 [Hebeloma cylindrosporum]|uniref:Uncharacterized protein n=1 Tax=Hebeloma cylindrosporum TaxID=76867 RepID=A0A0C2Y775_HEBCY|nr:hypothetical protein M413DRAFT_345653 [Hebeloma cylindrosporum h7]